MNFKICAIMLALTILITNACANEHDKIITLTHFKNEKYEKGVGVYRLSNYLIVMDVDNNEINDLVSRKITGWDSALKCKRNKSIIKPSVSNKWSEINTSNKCDLSISQNGTLYHCKTNAVEIVGVISSLKRDLKHKMGFEPLTPDEVRYLENNCKEARWVSGPFL